VLLSGKVAIVTGGAKGIGKSIATKFAKEGCSIAIGDISVKEAEETVAFVKKEGVKAAFIKCDVTNSENINGMVDQVIKEFGKIDILVNNAGGIFGMDGPIDTVTEESWDKIFDLNLKSQFLVSKAVAPHMKARKFGKIINISSMGAISPPMPVMHYCTAKAGVLGFTTNLAIELAHYNINVNAILPGPIRTAFHQLAIDTFKLDADEYFEGLGHKEVPLGRYGTPDDIAGVALFLASELSSFVTGEFIKAGGGLPLPVWSPPPAP
jgi:NAD(P)-dependent dehydrogenase (short-subunit alcohol dehydrogenase family)